MHAPFQRGIERPTIQARYFLLARLYLDRVFSSVRHAELGAAGATFGLAFFGFFASRLLRCWPFAMSVLLESRQGLDQAETE
jgi:hypothetical protein